MGILSRALAPFQKKNQLSQHGTLQDANFWTELSVNHPWPGAGDHFSVMAALRAGFVISQGMGQMPLSVKHEKEDVNGMVIRREATDERVYKLLSRRPNDWMTSAELVEALTLQAVFTGAGRALIRRGVDDRPLELLPLHPRWVNAYHDEAAREFIYEIGVSEYGIYGRFTRDDILEITNPRWDFVQGMDITRKAASALGLAQNLENRQRKLTETNAPYGIITSEQGVGTERVKALKKAWTTQFGEGNGIGILDFEAKFQQMMGTPQDQQTIENRKFQIEEVARAFGVFPHMLMSTEGTTTNATVQELFSQHIVHTIRPWKNRWEQALNRTFFDDSRHLSAVFEESGLFRSSPLDQAEFAARALGSGGNVPWMTVNEVRQSFGQNPIEGGDELVSPTGNTAESPSVGAGDI